MPGENERSPYVANATSARLLFAFLSFSYEPSGFFHYLYLCGYRIGSAETVLRGYFRCGFLKTGARGGGLALPLRGI
ncbi:hypothetical protein ABIA27_004025 [Sinorhizobium fredii]